MRRRVEELEERTVTLRNVEIDPDNHNIWWGTGTCPRCRAVTRFKQQRFPMNYWKMPNQVWECQNCEWDFPGHIEGPVRGAEAEEPDEDFFSLDDD